VGARIVMTEDETTLKQEDPGSESGRRRERREDAGYNHAPLR
jgi:hypothetical protein